MECLARLPLSVRSFLTFWCFAWLVPVRSSIVFSTAGSSATNERLSQEGQGGKGVHVHLNRFRHSRAGLRAQRGAPHRLPRARLVACCRFVGSLYCLLPFVVSSRREKASAVLHTIICSDKQAFRGFACITVTVATTDGKHSELCAVVLPHRGRTQQGEYL